MYSKIKSKYESKHSYFSDYEDVFFLSISCTSFSYLHIRYVWLWTVDEFSSEPSTLSTILQSCNDIYHPAKEPPPPHHNVFAYRVYTLCPFSRLKEIGFRVRVAQ